MTRKRRTRAQLHFAGETIESLKQALERGGEFIPPSSDDALEHCLDMSVLGEEILILEGKLFPPTKEFDHA